MKKFGMVALILAGVLAGATSANATGFTAGDYYLVSFTITGSNGVNPLALDSTVTLQASALSSTELNLFGGTGTGTLVGWSVPSNPTPGVESDGYGVVPAAYIPWDQEFFPNSSPVVSDNGLLFDTGSGASLELINIYSYNGALYWNIWQSGANGQWQFNTDNPPYGNPVEMTDIDVVPSPEPSSLILLGTGLLLMAGFVLRRAKAAPSMIASI